MKKALALLLSLSMMVSLFAACGSGDTTTTEGDSADTSSSSSDQLVSTGDNVVNVDDLVAPSEGEPEGIQPGTSVTISAGTDFATQLLPYIFNGARYFYAYAYDTLFWDANNDGIVSDPLLVESYTASEDMLTWVLTLHDDIYFHNGNNLNAASVVGSFDFYIEQDLVMVTDDFESYEATGEHEVTLVLTTVGAETPSFMGMYIFDHTSYEELGYCGEAALGAGSGPYEITSFAIGDNVTLKAVENYWYPERQAHIENVTMEIITNTTTAFNAVAAGDLAYGAFNDSSYYELLVGSEDHVIITSQSEPAIIWMNPVGLSEDMANPVIREALIMMVDTQQIMLAATGGYGTEVFCPLNGAFEQYYTNDHVYDPEAGLALLEAEGIDPSDIVLTAIVNTAGTAPYTNLQSQLMDYGITLDFVASDQNVVMTAGIAGEWDFWTEHGGLSALPTYSGSVKNFWSTPASTSVIRQADHKEWVGDKVDLATSTLDIDEFYSTLVEICEYCDENYLYLCAWQGVSWNVFSPDIVNPVVDASVGQWRIFDSWIAE